MDFNKNYYDILGINNTTNIKDIKKQYKKLAFKYHPDKNNGDKTKENIFKTINDAYTQLCNNKEKYDSFSIYGKDYSPPPPHSTTFVHDGFYENLDITINVIITLKTVYVNDPLQISYMCNIKCEDCDGSGLDRASESFECEMCNSTGKNEYLLDCKYCLGLGKIFTGICKICNGKKTTQHLTYFNLKNISNMRNSEKKYLKEYGHQSRYYRNKKGTLILNIIYQNCENYKIENNVLIYHLDLHYKNAIDGIDYIYDNLDGKKLKIKIPEKTKDGDKIRLKNKGLIVGGVRGDLILIINIIVDYNII